MTCTDVAVPERDEDEEGGLCEPQEAVGTIFKITNFEETHLGRYCRESEGKANAEHDTL